MDRKNVSNDPVAHFRLDWIGARGCIRIREDESISHIIGKCWRRVWQGSVANSMNIEHRSRGDVGGRNFVSEVYGVV